MLRVLIIAVFATGCSGYRTDMSQLLSDKKATEDSLASAQYWFSQHDRTAKDANRAGDTAGYRLNLGKSVDADMAADSLNRRLRKLTYSIDSLEKLK